MKDVSVSLRPGETLGLVGESGSGKTTFARLLLGLVPPDEGGSITLEGKALAPRLDSRTDDQIKAMQIVFQNPDSALNRSHSIRHLISRALKRLAGLRGAHSRPASTNSFVRCGLPIGISPSNRASSRAG
ncbi:hypothetical protein AJ88_10165 [Mesorhizobium amorphae CCBAU 01583]|nr:hypothetical protein AJ88_10165 [Mesorhizobium amorphae CCBAU 01583]